MKTGGPLARSPGDCYWQPGTPGRQRAVRWKWVSDSADRVELWVSDSADRVELWVSDSADRVELWTLEVGVGQCRPC